MHSSQVPVATFTRDDSLRLCRMPAPEGVEQSLEHEDLYVERFGQSHGSIKEENSTVSTLIAGHTVFILR